MLIKRSCHLIICFLVMLLLAGCWDSVPIEDRGFVVGSAIDLKDGKINGNYHLTLTNQFVVPPGVGTPSGGGSGNQAAFTNLSASGNSVFAIDAEMASLTSKMPFFEHLKILIVSEELVDTPHLLANIMDVFVRDKEMRRGIKVIVADEKAKDILDIQPENEKLPAIYINELLEDSLKKTSLFKPIHVGDIHEYLLTNSSFTIPKVSPLKNKIKYEGSAVFHGFKDKVVGSLNKEEMTGLNLITSGPHGGTLEFKFEGHLITFRIYSAKSAVKINTKDPENLKISVDIGLEGGIAEIFGENLKNNPENIAEIEKAAAKKIEELVNKTVEKAQKDFNAEIFGFDAMLRQRHYDTWQKIKDDWDQGKNYFAKSDIQVKAKVKVRTAGASKKTESSKKEE